MLVWKILEEYALTLTQKPGYGITMEEFLQAYRTNGGESLARDIWQSLTEPTTCDEEDAGNRLTSRTLLKPAPSGYVFLSSFSAGILHRQRAVSAAPGLSTASTELSYGCRHKL